MRAADFRRAHRSAALRVEPARSRHSRRRIDSLARGDRAEGDAAGEDRRARGAVRKSGERARNEEIPRRRYAR